MALSDALKHFAQGGIQFVSITQELQRFRLKLESEADQPIEQIEVNAAALLSDLAVFLKLGAAQHNAILGPRAVGYLAGLLQTRVSATTQH